MLWSLLDSLLVGLEPTPKTVILGSFAHFDDFLTMFLPPCMLIRAANHKLWGPNDNPFFTYHAPFPGGDRNKRFPIQELSRLNLSDSGFFNWWQYVT